MYNTSEIELNILDFWEKKSVFEKLVAKNKGRKHWSFIDGPITANNPMGVHHAWGRTYKDLYQRFKAMQGYDQRFQNGFDCQGLWVEVEVEKDLGLNSKKDIEEYGIEKFSLKCRERVDKYSKIQTDQSIRLGQWNNWQDSYYTLSDNNMEHIWYFLRKCYDNKWLFKGSDSMPWCYRCGTSLSQHELYDSYKELTHLSLFLKFPIKDNENEFLLVWTTTPWTLSANVAVAVHPELIYARVKQGNDVYYLSEGTLNSLKGDYVVLETIPGKRLIGLEYYGPFRDVEAQKNVKPRIVGWDLVSQEEGTGIVHIAPGCGKEDHDLGKKERLPEIAPLDEAGNFINGFGWLTGKNVANTTKDIVKDLEKKGFIYNTKNYLHRYPTCWRCGTELVFRLVDEWFIDVNEIRPLMIKANKTVRWEPEHVGKLMEDWLMNMGNWVISRKRYWGLPLPIWECENKHIEVISTKDELIKKAISGVKQLKELHRPWIDNVKIKCMKCNKEMTRIKDVGDAWLDAGIVPFSTLNYLHDREYWKKWFPTELVCEMREQVRLWFYSLMFMSVTLENRAPYRKVFSYEKVYDEHGKPMHKSAGNAIWFDDSAEKMGVDVMRWMYCKQDPKFNLNFGYKMAGETKQTLSLLLNLSSYLEISLQGKKPRKPKSFQIEDLWAFSKLNNLVNNTTKNLEGLKPNIAAKSLEDFFVATFSRSYIQYVRDRVQSSIGKNKESAIYTLYAVNLTLLKLLSPFIPFITEHLYQNNFKKYEKTESIHLLDWPKSDKRQINNELEKNFGVAEKIMQAILFGRDKAKIGVRWPLKEVIVFSTNKDVKNCLEALEGIIKKQTNIKKVSYTNKDVKNEHIDFEYGSVYLNIELDENLEKEGYSRELIRRIQNLRKNAGLKKENKIELVINTDYDLKKYADEIKDITGASSLSFEKAKKQYKHKSVERIKEKEFEILFNVL
ncbi:MAG: isoleucine--tRNA ligase [Nanoarchaeota archaeon]